METKRFVILNWCENSDVAGILDDTPKPFAGAWEEALDIAKSFASQNGLDSDCIQEDEDNGLITLDYCGNLHYYRIEAVKWNHADPFGELCRLLAKHGIGFTAKPISREIDGHKLTICLTPTDSKYDPPISTSYCPELECFFDECDDSSQLDAQEVCIWWLNELKSIEIPYGEA